MNTKYDGDGKMNTKCGGGTKGSINMNVVCFLTVTMMTRPRIPTTFCQRVRPVKITRHRMGRDPKSNRG